MNNTRVIALVISIFLAGSICAPAASSQESIRLSSTRYNIRNGFPTNEISAIRQDDNGFIWMASNSGIIRFDGYDFLQIKSTWAQPSKLLSNHISGMDVCGDRIALTHNNGAEVFDQRSRISTAVGDSLIAGGNMRAALFLTPDKVLFGGLAGLFAYDIAAGTARQLVCHGTNGENILNNIRTVFKDSSSNIWIGTWMRGVFFIPAGTEAPMHISDALPSDLFVTSFADDGNYIYISTWDNGIYQLEIDRDGFSATHLDPFAWKARIIYSIAFDTQGRMWVGTPGGLRVLTKGKGGLEPVQIDEGQDLSIVGHLRETKTVFCDRAGNIWITGMGDGVVKTHYISSAAEEVDFQRKGLDSREVSAVYRDAAGTIWAGVYGQGFVCYDPGNGQFLSLPDSPSLRELRTEGNAVVRFIPLPKQERMAMSTRYFGVYVADLKQGQITALTHYDTASEGIRNAFTFDAAADASGNIWVATDHGAVLLRNTLDGYMCKEPADLNRLLEYDHVTTVLSDSQGYLWLSTQLHGLVRVKYDMLGDNITEHSLFSRALENLPDQRINCLYESSNGTIWAGGAEFGLQVFNPLKGIFEMAEGNASLPSQVICSICEDNSGMLWISTDAGFACYDPDSETKITYSSSLSEDLLNLTFIPRSVWSDASGIIFGGYRGISICHPEKISKSSPLAKPMVTGISILGRPAEGLRQMPPYTKDLTLKRKERSLHLTFASCGAENPGSILYAYRLDRPDKRWNYCGADTRSVTYSNLRAGKYTFRVKAMSVPGGWTQEEILRIRIRTSPWIRWWSIAIYALIILSISWTLHSMRRKQVSLSRDLESFRDELARQSYPAAGNSLDKKLIDKAVKIIEDNLSDPDFGIDEFNNAMSMSNSTLYRKIKALTGKAPKEFIRSVRFKYACRFLLEKSGNVSEVAYLVGFSNAKYFSQSFKKEFGKTPSQYIREYRKNNNTVAL